MKKLRGKALDKKLEEILSSMVLLDYRLSPISRSTLMRRLGLKSRGTLAIKNRAEMIQLAREQQLKNSGVIINKRNTLKQQNENLKTRIIELEKERDLLVEKMAMIINGAQAKGYDVEEIMMPLIKY